LLGVLVVGWQELVEEGLGEPVFVALGAPVSCPHEALEVVGAGEDPKDVDGRLSVQAGLERSVAQESVDDGSGVDPAFMFGGLPELSEFGVGAGAASEHLGEVGGALVQSHDVAGVESERLSGVGLVEGLGEPGALGQGDRLVVAGDRSLVNQTIAGGGKERAMEANQELTTTTLERLRQACGAWYRSDPAPDRAMWSRREPVSLLGALAQAKPVGRRSKRPSGGWPPGPATRT
jgi:hypothetical protein